MLALLALRNGIPVSADQLADLLWGDNPIEKPRASIKTYIGHLRAVIGREWIETVPTGYRLAVAPEDVDICRFERLLQTGTEALDAGDLARAARLTTEALALWRGEPLSDLPDNNQTRATEAARLWELRRAGQERNFAARLELGHHAELIGDLRKEIELEPLRERLWGQLMVALCRSGRQVEALREFQALRTLLAEQVGVEPNVDLQTLETAILNQEPDVSLTPVRVTPPPAPPGQALPRGNVTFVFTEVERSTRPTHGPGVGSTEVLETYGHVLRSVFAAFGGMEVHTEGDGLFVVFADAGLAIGACLGAQRALTAHESPSGTEIRFRMGLHIGIARPSEEGDYHADEVDQAARICSAAHGGQVLLSADTARLVRHFLPEDAALVDRGAFMLNGFDEPERIFQLTHPALRSAFPPLRASPAQSHNLPNLRLSFVGRATDREAVDHMIGESRLVTLVGPGGVGKTRLAVELGARAAYRFEGGVHICDLSPQADPDLVLASLAEALGVRETPGRDPFAGLAEVLADRETLVLLDSCEHLVKGVSAAVDHLLSEVNNLHILATSREPLGVTGEHIWRLTPLDVPMADADVEAMRQVDSVQLFEERARLCQPAFTVTEVNAAAVGDICRQLEGLPLAIELAAAQVASLPPSAIAERLRERTFAVDVTDDRPAARHRNLEATVDWSYRLLDAESRRLLRLLSVFANGFTIDGARAVADSADPLATLAILVNKSLVIWDADASRYRMLESIRGFARVRLEEAGEADLAASRHLGWCATLAGEMRSRARSGSKYETYDLLDRELDNLRAALDWAARHSSLETAVLADAVQTEAEGSDAPDWWLVAMPDRNYYEQMESEGDVRFPLVPIPRRFQVDGRATIGRASALRGIAPDIDLSAAPTDIGVSHLHAILQRQPDGTWTVTDPGSTNRTYINDNSEPIPFDLAVPVGEDDRIHIGAWTTLTLQRMT